MKFKNYYSLKFKNNPTLLKTMKMNTPQLLCFSKKDMCNLNFFYFQQQKFEIHFDK